MACVHSREPCSLGMVYVDRSSRWPAMLTVMTMNYRDEENNPRYDEPKMIRKPDIELTGKRILLVDDVSVSGKTLNAAMEALKGLDVKTLAMKGKADYVLFPEVKDCVKWPWKS